MINLTKKIKVNLEKNNRYLTLKNANQKKVDNFPMFFAFSKSQFEQGLNSINCKKEEVVNIGAGGYVRQQDFETFNNLIEEIESSISKNMQNFNFAVDAFEYELGNHEFIITFDLDDTLEALNITYTDLENNKTLKDALRVAKKKYMDWQEKHG